jgi:drug/metabolite transporter (DMT)-like permease
MACSHFFLWFSGNTQFLVSNTKLALLICLIGGIIGTLFTYTVSRIGYGKYSMWELRMMGFASSYLIFPFLTWIFFHETPFNPKMMVSIGISVILVCVQVFWK